MNEAYNIIQQMKQENVDPNLQIFSFLLRGYIEGDQLEKALELIQQMEQQHKLPPYRKLVRWYGEKGEVIKIQKIIEEMEKGRVTPNAEIYHFLASAYKKQGQKPTVEEMEKMKKVGVSFPISNPVPTTDSE